MAYPLIALRLVKRYWKPAAVLIALLLIWLHGNQHGTQHERSKWELLTAKQSAQSARALAKAEAEARTQEQKWAAAFDVAATIQHEEMKNVQAHRDRLLSAIAAGRLRLPACPDKVPATPADSGESQAGAEGGQFAMAGEELVARLATCDEVTLERNQAVALLKAERR